jgi:hypothetical protein
MELWKDEAAGAARAEEYRGGLSARARHDFFTSEEIHSPKPASGAASNNLSTAVETRVDIQKPPAQRRFFVA